MPFCIVGTINNVTQICECVANSGYVESEDFYSKSNCAIVYNYTLGFASMELICFALLLLYLIYKNWGKDEGKRVASKNSNEEVESPTPSKGMYLFLCIAVLTRIMWFISGRSSLLFKFFWWFEFALQCVINIDRNNVKDPLYFFTFVFTVIGLVFSFSLPLGTYTFFLSSVFHYTLACVLLIVMPIKKPNDATVDIKVYTWVRRIFLALTLVFAYLGEYYNPVDTTAANLFWFLSIGVFIFLEELYII